MKFLRNSTLLTRSILISGLLSILFVFELYLLQTQMDRVERLHYHQDIARKAQLKAQEVFALTQAALNGDQQAAPLLLSKAEEHSHLLSIVGNGGRAEGSSVFLGPLSRLPRISFDELTRHWESFNQEVTNVVEGKQVNATILATYVQGQWQTLSTWYDRLLTDLDVDMSQARMWWKIQLWVFSLLDLSIFVLVFMGFRARILRPLMAMEVNTKSHEHTTGLPNDELGKAAHEVNEVIEQLRDASEFVRQIGEGNLSLEYTSLDAAYAKGKNKLADSLIEMQTKLRELDEEDGRRRWVNEGLTKFVEILRSSDADIMQLGDRIMSTLTQYTQSNQGGLYLLNDEDPKNPHLELVSLFAFDIKKFEKKKVKLGEGLLGQTFLERETTYLTHVPQDYVRITSGLGEDNPRSLLIVPLRLDQKVYGVVELASFNLFAPHEISFVEKLGESIASTLASARSAQQTHRLLDESKSATEMMRAQEEEMRQNMEELQATQEEMGRKERDYLRRIEKLEAELAADTSRTELTALRDEYAKMKAAADKQIEELKGALATRSVASESWEGMDELDRTLRINLEAVKVAHEALKGRTK